MNCSVPGCKRDAGEPVRIKASEAVYFADDAYTQFQQRARLCDMHRGEFEKLGWLAPEPNEES